MRNSLSHDQNATPASHQGRGVVLYPLIFFLVAAFAVSAKYLAVTYNAIDLAIFSQTIHQSAFGNLFGLTIHPHAYLGDHASYALLLLAPLYRLLPHPLTLLIAQAAVLASTVWPLRRLMRHFIKKELFVTILIAAFFLHPFVHSYALFEFELLVFSVPLLFWAIVAYHEGRFRLFLLLLVGLALLREDFGLVLLGWAALAWMQHRPKRWVLPIAALGAATIVAGGFVTALVNGEQYKFLAYYGWIGDLPTQPFLLLSVLFRLQNILLLVGLFLLAGPLALRKPRYLLPTALPLASIVLMGSAPSLLELQTHYTALSFPFILWASLIAVRAWEEKPPSFFTKLFIRPTAALVTLSVTTAIYGYFTVSPLRPSALATLAQSLRSSDARLARAFLAEVRDDTVIAAGLRFLPHLSGKQELYSMHYVARGKRQLSSLPYELPTSTTTILLDAEDAIASHLQYGDRDDRFTGADNRIRAAMETQSMALETMMDSFLLLRKNGAGNLSVYETGKQENVLVQPRPGSIQLMASNITGNKIPVTRATLNDQTFSLLQFSLTWKKTNDDGKTYDIRIRFASSDGRVAAERILPFAAGLFPTPEWPQDEPVTIPISLLAPPVKRGVYAVSVEPVAITGYLGLDALRSAKPIFTRIDALAAYPIGTIEITEPDT